MRRTGAAVCLVLGLGMVSGCTPAHLTLVAVTNGEDGRPVAVLQPCDDGSEPITAMRLESWPTGSTGAGTDDAGTEGAGEGRAGTESAGEDGAGTEGAGEGRAGTESAGEDGAGTEGAGEDRASVEDGGWEVPRGMTHRGRAVISVLSPPDSWLVEGGGARELLPGRTYSLSFYSYDGEYYGDGAFTADDLASLRPGQVWAAGRAMSVDEFADQVGEVC
ncbi:hypothetical protein ABT026_09910 [Streptomyces sp. NPDC002734]|uniref:hypothetical protein n=1 Tax=Streptomyces sp. NPDC002734 TaxID=3154426 RepID=UPI0033222EBC